MGLFGKIADAVKGVVHGVEHVAEGAAHAMVHEVQQVGKQVLLAGEGVVSGAIIKPIDGIEQLANKVTGAHLPMLELPNQQEVDSSWAGRIGEVAGAAAAFVATDGAVSAATGLAGASAGALAITGAVEGGVLTPSDNSKSGMGFLLDRFENAGIDAATFSTMGGVGGKVAGWVNSAEQSALHPLIAAGMPTAVGGAVSGVVNAEAESLLKQGKLASPGQLESTVLNNAVLGGALGIAGHGAGSLANTFRFGPNPGAVTGADGISNALQGVEPADIANNAVDQAAIRGELTNVLDGRGPATAGDIARGMNTVRTGTKAVNEVDKILGDFGINL